MYIRVDEEISNLWALNKRLTNKMHEEVKQAELSFDYSSMLQITQEAKTLINDFWKQVAIKYPIINSEEYMIETLSDNTLILRPVNEIKGTYLH